MVSVCGPSNWLSLSELPARRVCLMLCFYRAQMFILQFHDRTSSHGGYSYCRINCALNPLWRANVSQNKIARVSVRVCACVSAACRLIPNRCMLQVHTIIRTVLLISKVIFGCCKFVDSLEYFRSTCCYLVRPLRPIIAIDAVHATVNNTDRPAGNLQNHVPGSGREKALKIFLTTGLIGLVAAGFNSDQSIQATKNNKK